MMQVIKCLLVCVGALDVCVCFIYLLLFYWWGGVAFSEMGVREILSFDSSNFLVVGSTKLDIWGPQSLFNSPSVTWYIGNVTVHTAIIYAF